MISFAAAETERGASSDDGTQDQPPDWKAVTLGALAELSTEGIDPRQGQGLRYVGLEHLDPASPRVVRSGNPANVRSQKTLFQAGDVLYGKLRPYLDKAALAEWPGLCSTDILVLRPKASVCPVYLAHLLHTRGFVDHAVSTTVGVNHPRTSWSSLRSFTIAIAPLTEQRAIAHVLQTVQRAREATERILAATRELKRSLLRHLFTYGPVPVEEADKVALRETAYGSIPSAWRVLPLGECAEVQSGVTKGRDLSGSAIVELPYLRVANVQDGFLDLSEIKTIPVRSNEVDRYRLRPGDILMTEGGDPDKLGRGFVWRGEISPCLHQNHIFAVRPSPDLLDTDFFSYLIQSDYGKGYFLHVAHRTTNLASINLTKLKALPVPLPMIDMQRRIAEHAAIVNAKLRAEEHRRQALDALFTSLLGQLMIGKVRVPVKAEVAGATG